jgi:hypothetical protein
MKRRCWIEGPDFNQFELRGAHQLHRAQITPKSDKNGFLSAVSFGYHFVKILTPPPFQLTFSDYITDWMTEVPDLITEL